MWRGQKRKGVKELYLDQKEGRRKKKLERRNVAINDINKMNSEIKSQRG